MQVRLVVSDQASKESNTFDLAIEEKVTIGRHLGSPVVLQGDGLSRHHFSLMVKDGALTVEDLSSNGTWLNGALLKSQLPARVKSGDIIEVPGYEIRVSVQDVVALQTPPVEVETPLPLSVESGASGKRPLITALHILEPRETALLLFAAASFALISYFLNS